MVEHVEAFKSCGARYVVARRGCYLIEYAQRVAHGAVGLARYQRQSAVFGGYSFVGGHHLEVVDHVAY